VACLEQVAFGREQHLALVEFAQEPADVAREIGAARQRLLHMRRVARRMLEQFLQRHFVEQNERVLTRLDADAQ